MAAPDSTRNVEGATTAITTFSTVRWWGRVWLPVLFAATRRIPVLTAKLRDLSFIHFARWSLIRELPVNGTRGGKLRYPHMYFESNFNGSWDEYIDAFARKLSQGMSAFWSSSYGFPGPLPTGPFKDYIRSNETVADHYWSAYPGATTTMITRALVLAGDKVRGGPVPAGGTNVSGQAYAFMAMTPVRPGHEDALTTLLQTMDPSPFEKLPGTHMGRFVVVRDFHFDPEWGQPFDEHLDDAYLVFTSNFDGPLDDYLSVLGVLPEADAIWRHCVACPESPAKDASVNALLEHGEQVADYLRHNQVHTGLFYAPYGDATVRDVLSALRELPVEDAPEWASDTPVVRVHIARGVRILREQYDRYLATKPAVAERDQHPHGQCVRGTLTIREDLPPAWRHGIAATPGAALPVVARFSANAPIRLPWGRDAHGAALMVPGQHFILSNTEGFFAKDAADSTDLVIARGKGGPGLLHYFLGVNPRKWRLRELRNAFVAVTRYVPNPLAIDYTSPSAIRWGPHTGKPLLLTHTASKRWRPFHRSDPGAALREQLATGTADFDLALRIHADPVRHPLNDPTRPWPADEPVVIGTVHFPSQEPTTGENLAFNLKHCLPEHASIDEVSAFREAAYPTTSSARNAYNATAAQTEPS